MPRPLIILNNSAARARRVWPMIKSELDAAKIEYDTHVTSAIGDATNRTRLAIHSGATLIVVVGGDGSLSEVAEGYFEFSSNPEHLPKPINKEVTLAVLPAGTGDDFARGLVGKRAPLNAWIKDLLAKLTSNEEPATRFIDVLYGRCDDLQTPFICLNASTMGIGGETASRVAAQGKFMRRFSGEFRFLFAALGALAVWRERRVKVSVDGKQISDGPMNLVAVANALYAGGGMKLSPDARLDDGKLDVVTASGLSRSNVITELSRVHKGGHVHNPKVNITQGEIVLIETLMVQDAMLIEADGNVRGVTPVRFEVIPSALQFMI
ncbi:MAG TPA: YegS/Rv2252/BmrU family lipid kinase [Pyrinomonadaceae bacterium]|nr:YegS/Rv2252/BmrU family lipid kinase [Pyrinomonadaceae bacterium]